MARQGISRGGAKKWLDTVREKVALPFVTVIACVAV